MSASLVTEDLPYAVYSYPSGEVNTFKELVGSSTPS
jgi:hypothetical protein